MHDAQIGNPLSRHILLKRACFILIDTSPVKSVEGCLNWDVIQRKVPWGIVLLLGGGFAIAEASDASGLSVWLGDQLSALKVLPVGVVVLIVTLMTAMVTEVASNTATASILMPVLKEMVRLIQDSNAMKQC